MVVPRSEVDIFEAIGVYEERHLTLLLETILCQDGAIEEFLKRLATACKLYVPDHGLLEFSREIRIGRRIPDLVITDEQTLLVLIENKVLPGSVSTDQIREEILDGFDRVLEFKPKENGRPHFVYVYIAPDPLELRISDIAPKAPPNIVFQHAHLPLNRLSDLLTWLKEESPVFHSDLERYIRFLCRSLSMKPLDNTDAKLVEALGEGGFGRIYDHAIGLADLVKRVATSELGTQVSFGRTHFEQAPAHTYVSIGAEWAPSWLRDIYIDVDFSGSHPMLAAVLQSKNVQERQKFAAKLRRRISGLRVSSSSRADDQNFASLRLTAKDVLRDAEAAAVEAGRTLVAFVNDVRALAAASADE